MVRSLSLGYFNCTSTDEFEVSYLNRHLGGLSLGASNKSVIVGLGTLGKSSRAGVIPLIRHIARVSRTGEEHLQRGANGSR